MKNISPPSLTDFYKTGHQLMYPEKTQRIISNFTPRGSRLPGVDKAVFFGMQYYILRYLQDLWNTNFFRLDKQKAIDNYQKTILMGLGDSAPSTKHLEDLWTMGFLPIEIRALPEGARVPMRVPMYTIHNTDDKFYWLVNFLETQMSCVLWFPCTSATIAYEFKKNFMRAALLTGADTGFCNWQGHDFSMRGHSSIESALVSGAAHLMSFSGTDTVPAIPFVMEYYGNNNDVLIAGSVPATEHAVVCAGGQENELQTLSRLLDTFPNILSYVSDTWDFWKLVTETLPALKTKIMSRKGKLVIRPDSGDPVKILIGDPDAQTTHEKNGLIQTLWNIFGGTRNANGFMVLDPHIGAIYGDSINLDRQVQILDGLREKSFASSNIVLGIGSYTYQYVTRDTLGFAIKATHAIIDSKSKDLYKDPKTDSGVKKSARGRVMVIKNSANEYELIDEVTEDQFNSKENCLKTIYKDGAFLVRTNFTEIRNSLEVQVRHELTKETVNN